MLVAASVFSTKLQELLALEKPAHLSDEKWTLLVAAALLPSPGEKPGGTARAVA